MKEKIAVVRVRGLWGVKPKIKETLKKLNLTRVNHCVVVEDNSSYNGMLKIVKDYVAYGPISKPMMVKLLKKRGAYSKTKKLDFDDKKIDDFVNDYYEGKKTLKDIELKPVFRLRPPKRGYKSTKKRYPYGSLGKWPTMDELLMKMI